MMPFVGAGSIHEAMSVRGEFSTISSVKFLGAEGTETRSRSVNKHSRYQNPKLSEGGAVVDFW